MRLIERRNRLSLTWSGKLLFLLLAIAIGILLIRSVYGFLAVSSTPQGDYFVVEGWLPDSALEDAVHEFKNSGCNSILTTGIVMTDLVKGMQPYDSYAEYGYERLIKLQVSPDIVTAVSSDERIRDRTYHSALALRAWFEENQIETSELTVVTKGAHARRTRLIYRMVFGKKTSIHVLALSERSFDPKSWWRSSQGVKTVSSETIAYLYAKFLFFP